MNLRGTLPSLVRLRWLLLRSYILTVFPTEYMNEEIRARKEARQFDLDVVSMFVYWFARKGSIVSVVILSLLYVMNTSNPNWSMLLDTLLLSFIFSTICRLVMTRPQPKSRKCVAWLMSYEVLL